MARGAWHEIVKTVPHMHRSGEFPRSSLKIFHDSVGDGAFDEVLPFTASGVP